MSLSREILSPVTTAGLLYERDEQSSRAKSRAAHTRKPNRHAEHGGERVSSSNLLSYYSARQFLQNYSLTASNSITFPKQSGSPAAVVNQVAEGAEFPMDVTAYSAVNVVPYKVAHGFIITRETIEDSLIPIQQDQLARAALRVANKVDKDCISVINTGRSGSTAATGKSLALNGTEFVLSGSGGLGIGMYTPKRSSVNDIIAAKSLVENNNYMPDRESSNKILFLRETLLVHPRAKVFIERLPHFTAQYSYGEPRMQTGFIATPGKFGDILGLDAYASTNCPTGSAFVLSRGRTTNILGQYKGVG